MVTSSNKISASLARISILSSSQPPKGLPLSEVMVSGKVIVVIAVNANALLPIEETPDSNVTSAREVQSSNALLPITVSLPFIVTAVILPSFANAYAPMFSIAEESLNSLTFTQL